MYALSRAAALVCVEVVNGPVAAAEATRAAEPTRGAHASTTPGRARASVHPAGASSARAARARRPSRPQKWATHLREQEVPVPAVRVRAALEPRACPTPATSRATHCWSRVTDGTRRRRRARTQCPRTQWRHERPRTHTPVGRCDEPPRGQGLGGAEPEPGTWWRPRRWRRRLGRGVVVLR